MSKVEILENNEVVNSVEVDGDQNLAEVLSTVNSPILFGCRTGVCGTCCVKVVKGMENLNLKTAEEDEILELYVDDMDNARLACQLEIKGDISLEYIGK